MTISKSSLSSWLVIAAALTPGMPTGASAQNQPGDNQPGQSPPAQNQTTQTEPQTIARIEFQGLRQVTQAYCRSQIVSAAGRQFSAAIAEEDRRRLIRSGKFLDVRITPAIDSQSGGVVVVFAMSERPILEAIEFIGNVQFSDRSLMKDLDLAAGDPLNRFRVELAARTIEQRYHDAGYADATVTFDRDVLDRDRSAVFTIEEGPRTRVREIRIEGNINFDDKAMEGLIQTETYFPILRTGDFNPDRAESDVAEIQNFYRDHGYLDARASYQTEALQAPGDLAVVFVVAEGDLYTIGNISFEGNVVMTRDELLGRMRLQPGATMRQDHLRDDVQTLKDTYGELGYLTPEWGRAPDNLILEEPLPVFTEQPGEVELSFRIREGKPYRIGRIVTRGNTTTQDKVIRRELAFYPDELFHVPNMRLSESRLRRSELFDFAKISPVGDQDQIRDVVVDVRESQRTINFLFGGGVGSNSGVAGSISYESRNFDIQDWPESWAELFRARSFRGAGQYFRIDLSPGTEVSSFRIVFRDNWFLDRPLNFGSNLYLFQRDREEYDEQRLGVVLSLGKVLETGWFKNWSGELAFRLEDVEIDDLTTFIDDLSFPADDIKDAEGHSILTTFKGRLTKNSTDSRLLPTRGDVWTLSAEQAAGSYTFTKLDAGYTWYKALRTDDQNRKSVLALKADAGVMFGNVPVFERYYAGGIGSLRGFDFRGVTPRDGPFWDDDQRIGGDFRLLTGAEYSFPLWDKTLRGVLFSDMGTVEEDIEITSWRASVGIGLRLLVEQLAPVPFEFNFAWPVAKDDDDDTQVFSFALGLTF